ncbi:MAG: tyrosinase family protein [Chthoniobacter sp.]|nr:tyrosinase family protein [Chthoniobacter sp.]
MTNRKSTANLTTVEKQRFVSVLNQLITAPGDPNPYGTLVDYHRHHMQYMIHPNMGPQGVERFLPWHRDFVLKAEAMGQAVDPQFFIPYWEWTVERQVPPFLVNFLPTIRTPAPHIVVVRHPGPPNQLPTAASITQIKNQSATFDAFTNAIDVPHGIVHNWMGGTMSNINDSPGDPIFWTHHAMIDKIWSEWQVNHPNQNSNPSPAWRTLTPWTETVAQVRDITTLGYAYV